MVNCIGVFSPKRLASVSFTTRTSSRLPTKPIPTEGGVNGGLSEECVAMLPPTGCLFTRYTLLCDFSGIIIDYVVTQNIEGFRAVSQANL